MKQLELIRLLEAFALQKKRFFTLKEAAVYWGAAKPAAAMALLRGQKNGLVWRVKNLWINRRDPPVLENLALALSAPSYISFETALYRRGVLSQSPRGALTLATLKRPGTVATPLGQVRMIHLKPSLFFGFDAERMAYPEKAYLDSLYIRFRKGEKGVFSETLYRDQLNKRRLRQWARVFPASLSGLIENP